MKTKHLFDDGYYFISNKAVAKNYLFAGRSDIELFHKKIEKHLSQISHILAYGFLQDEFQLVVRLKSRKELEAYYKDKNGSGNNCFVPESTYIFAQAIANLQSGYVKGFNFRHKRDGGLMKGRYFRKLIETEKELDDWIGSVNGLKEIFSRNEIWTFRRKGKEAGMMSSLFLYKKGMKGKKFKGLVAKEKIYLRGHFANLPPKQILFKNEAEKVKNYLTFLFNREMPT